MSTDVPRNIKVVNQSCYGQETEEDGIAGEYELKSRSKEIIRVLSQRGYRAFGQRRIGGVTEDQRGAGFGG